MSSGRVVVLGAGTAGLATALALGRAGRAVTLIERDPIAPSPPEDASRWVRKGIPHFLQPHAFIPRGRKELKEHFEDVYASLIAAGAYDVDLRPKLPGTPEPADEDLQYLGVRRPTIEWGLRAAVLAQPNVEVRSAAHADGVRIERDRVTAVCVGGVPLNADVVVDAMGRRSPLRGWLAEQECGPVQQHASDCGVVYYSRYYRLRAGLELPDGPWIVSPRGDLGYMGYASFPGDNGTFAAVLAVPSGVADLKIFKDERAFETAVAAIPMLRRWADRDRVDPITPVLPMGGLLNTINRYDEAAPCGVFPSGDAFSHTDPVLAHGLSFSLIHGLEIARALHEHGDARDAFEAYIAETMPPLRERYDLATALDDQRRRMWTGQTVDFTSRTGDYALFSMVAAGAAAMVDPEVFRVFVRRIGLLDGTGVLDRDVALQERIERRFGDMRAKPRPAQGPPREEMLELCRAAARA